MIEEYRLRPGEVIGFLLAHDCEFIEGPYPTDEENEIFFEAQRGGYSYDDAHCLAATDHKTKWELLTRWPETNPHRPDAYALLAGGQVGQQVERPSDPKFKFAQDGQSPV